MALSARDVLGMRNCVASTLPDAVTLYDPTGATQLWSGTGRLYNKRAMDTALGRKAFYTLNLPYGTPAPVGSIVAYQAQALESDLLGYVPQSTTAYFILYRLLEDSYATTQVRATLIALPYTCTVTRTVKAPGRSLRGYGEPTSASDTTVTTRTIRVGFSNDNDPLIGTDMGAMPRGVRTAYTPLGSDVLLKDHITLPDGHVMVVQQRNELDADGDGVWFAYQLILNEL